MSKDDQKFLNKNPWSRNLRIAHFVILLEASSLQMACLRFNGETKSLLLQLEHLMIYSPCNVVPVVSCSWSPCSKLETK